MKKIFYVFIALTLCVLSCYADKKEDKKNKESKTVIDNILSRVSVRQFTVQKVEQEKINIILKAAMAAPSGMNLQPWEILVVNDKNKLEAVAQAAPNAKYCTDSSLTIIVCGDTKTSEKLWIQDCCAVTENILLAAHSQGLGAVWCMCYPAQDKVADVQKIFNLPKHVIPLSIIPIGYPDRELEPKKKFNSDKIHINGWNN